MNGNKDEKRMRRGGWDFIISTFRLRWKPFAAVFVISVLEAILNVRYALHTKDVIDGAVDGSWSSFRTACIVLLVIDVIYIFFEFAATYLDERMVADLDLELKKKIFHRLLDGKYAAVSRYHTGDLLNRINGDLGSLVSGFVYLIPSVAFLMTQLVISIVILFRVARRFTIWLVVFSIATVGGTFLVYNRVKAIHKRESEINGKVYGFIQEMLEKLLMIQALDVSEETERRGVAALLKRRRIQYKKKNMNLAFSTGSNLLSYAISFLSMCYFGWMLLQKRITFGGLTAMTRVAGLIISPFLRVPSLIKQLIGMTAAIERVGELTEIPSQSEEDENVGVCAGEPKYIEARNISFAYDRDKVLKDLSFRIPVGGITVITGASGIGKSTLLKLLLGIYRVEEGELVMVTDEGEIPLARTTRRYFTYVPQGNLLLSGTVRDNLLLTKPDAGEEEISQAVYASTMEEYLPKLADGLDTILGEGGNGLSEGQGQRLSLARAILRDAPILLLDEVTSALDMETEKNVLNRIRALPGKACIVVTHRLAVLDMADLHLHLTADGIEIDPPKEKMYEQEERDAENAG